MLFDLGTGTADNMKYSFLFETLSCDGSDCEDSD
jgi:hypothetical protein